MTMMIQKKKQEQRDLHQKGLAMQKALTAIETEVQEINDSGTDAATTTVPTNNPGEDGAGSGASGSKKPPSAKERRVATREAKKSAAADDAGSLSAGKNKRARGRGKESAPAPEPDMVCMYAPHSAHSLCTLAQCTFYVS